MSENTHVVIELDLDDSSSESAVAPSHLLLSRRRSAEDVGSEFTRRVSRRLHDVLNSFSSSVVSHSSNQQSNEIVNLTLPSSSSNESSNDGYSSREVIVISDDDGDETIPVSTNRRRLRRRNGNSDILFNSETNHSFNSETNPSFNSDTNQLLPNDTTHSVNSEIRNGIGERPRRRSSLRNQFSRNEGASYDNSSRNRHSSSSSSNTTHPLDSLFAYVAPRLTTASSRRRRTRSTTANQSDALDIPFGINDANGDFNSENYWMSLFDGSYLPFGDMLGISFRQRMHRMYSRYNNNPSNGTGRIGATACMIDRIPTSIINIGNKEPDECIICLNDMKNGDMIRNLPCKHGFHKECIDKWLKLNKVCPLDKRPIDAYVAV